MVKRIVRYCDITMEIIWLLALVSIPIYFNIYTSRVFEPDKITLFRSLMLILGLAWLVKWLAIWAADRQQKTSNWPARRNTYSNRKEEIEAVFEPDSDVYPPDARPFPRSFLLKPLVLPAMILVFMYVLATIFSVVPGVSWWGSYQRLEGAYTFVSYVILFMAIAFNMRERRQVERLISFVLLTNIPVALYGFLQHYKADPLPWQGDVTFRVTSTMGNAIFISAYLIMIVPLILYRVVVTARWLMVNRRLAERSFKGHQRNNALSWVALYGCFVIFEIGLFLAVLNLNASYHPAQSTSQGAPSVGLVGSKQPGDFSQVLGGDTGGPWWALPVGILLIFGIYFLFTVKRAGTDNNYLFRIFEFVSYLALGTISLLTILYSQSRGPLLGLLVALFIFAPILFWRRKLWRWMGVWLGAGAVLAALLLLFNLPVGATPLEPVFKIARQNPEIARLGQFLEANDGTGKVRQLIWKTDFEIIGNAAKNEPLRLLLGYGPESLYNISPPFYQPELAQVEARNAIPDRSHNGYLDALVTTGGFGFLAYIAVVFTFLFYAFRFLRLTNRIDYQVLLAALIAVIIGHQIEIQTGIQIAASWMMFWTSAGLVVVLGGLILGGYGRAVSQPVPAAPEEGVAEEPVAVAAAASSRGLASVNKPLKNYPKKGRPGEAIPVSANLAQSASAKSLTSVSINGKSRSQTSEKELAREKSGKNGTNKNGSSAAQYGPFGMGNFLFLGPDLGARKVKPWFWGIAGVAALVTLLYAYFANYMPVVADAYYKQGANFAAAQQWNKAAPYFREAIQEAPSEDYYYLFLGQSYLEQGRTLMADKTKTAQMNDLFIQSEQALKKAHELAPLNPDHYANLGRLYSLWASADPSRNEELLEKSISWYEQVVNTRAPRNARLWAELGAAYLNQGLTKRGGPDQALIDKAISAGQKSVEIDGVYDFNRLVLGDIYLIARQPDNAGPQYLKLAQLNLKQLGSDNKYNDRLRAIALSPLVSQADIDRTFGGKVESGQQAFLNTSLGGIYYYKNNLKDAESRLTASISLDTENPYSQAFLALVRAKQSRPVEAKAIAGQAVELARRTQDNSQTLNTIQQMLAEILK